MTPSRGNPAPSAKCPLFARVDASESPAKGAALIPAGSVGTWIVCAAGAADKFPASVASVAIVLIVCAVPTAKSSTVDVASAVIAHGLTVHVATAERKGIVTAVSGATTFVQNVDAAHVVTDFQTKKGDVDAAHAATDIEIATAANVATTLEAIVYAVSAASHLRMPMGAAVAARDASAYEKYVDVATPTVVSQEAVTAVSHAKICALIVCAIRAHKAQSVVVARDSTTTTKTTTTQMMTTKTTQLNKHILV